ncbi:MAG: hypothetical protein KGI00_05505 [Candidatus Micrarchaeota archaeon]|nr:hypothetical protein [Candidatus Micrarchaeota archaeon]MDE1850150.1 hypothetical protein [Candidatus Micrarchaeota archaeon]
MRSILQYAAYPILFLVTVYAIVSVTNYYETNFTHYYTAIFPTDKIFYYLTSSFNAYTEQVSNNGTVDYETFYIDLQVVILEIFLAYLSLLIFSTLYNRTKSLQMEVRRINHHVLGNYLAVAFFLSSILSIYLTVIIEYLQNVFGTGISGIGVQGLAIILVFSLINVFMMGNLARLKAKGKNPVMKVAIFGISMIGILFFVILLYFSVIQLVANFTGFSQITIQIHFTNMVFFSVIFISLVTFRRHARLFWMRIARTLLHNAR